eukprot:CAMPEP_0201093990 /NCGR_PEP_ID=MMETSP0812-20130820/2421_1 /ASSEMBLY_ACC=CAM_ASM_000668 /TAXON_ID=98059 /ORGANISM="Dinobryon sp., Strain UTEXLB2267" /LENGTH=94 /DNA_ID=CAMNT_0047346417 /DNA_START=100 /DNA_END=381 /DNA_ORIENTATION=+
MTKSSSMIPKRLMSLCRTVERQYCNSDHLHIIGVDEAGRGPLAGPVVAAACYIPRDLAIDGIIDSKATKEEDREHTYKILTSTEGVMWGVSIIS